MAKQIVDTKGSDYTNRLISLTTGGWKTRLGLPKIYSWNIQRQNPGRTLDIGCGIGRHLQYLSNDSVGIDHNRHSVKKAKALGLTAFTTNDFKHDKLFKPSSFDSLLVSHVLEHLTRKACLKLVNDYKKLLKSNGKIIVCCPQIKGYSSDSTHVSYLDRQLIEEILTKNGFIILKSKSFPLPTIFGKVFTYNEHFVVGQLSNR